MSVSVLNTDAGLTGKTLMVSESAQTITGAKTFDLDPSAPFIVTAGSAVVANLDADKLDGVEGSGYVNKTTDAIWTTYTPVWGNKGTANTTTGTTISGSYVTLGKICFYKISFAFGVGTVGGNGLYTWTLPATASLAGFAAGVAFINDAGTGVYTGVALLDSTTAITVYSSNAVNTGVANAVPMTWSAANGDSIQLMGFFQVA